MVLLLFDAFAPISFLLVLLLLFVVVVVCFAATGSFVENERLILLLLSGLVKAVKEVKVREKELQESFCSRSIALKLLRCRDKQAVEEAKHAFMCVRWINEENQISPNKTLHLLTRRVRVFYCHSFFQII